MSEVTRALLKHKMIPADCLRELRKWGSPLPTDLDATSGETSCVEDITREISEAFVSKEQVQFRTTDLDIMEKYGKEKQPAVILVPPTEADMLDEDIQLSVLDIEDSELKTEVVWLEENTVAIPWTSDDLSVWEYLVAENSVLISNEKKFVLKRVEPVFVGKEVIFVRCQVEETT